MEPWGKFFIDSNFWGNNTLDLFSEKEGYKHVYKNIDGGQLLKIYLPGIKKEDIVAKLEKESYLCLEFKDEDSAKVQRKYYIQEGVDTEKIKAEYKNGVLEIFFPYKESLTKTISIA